MKFQRIAWLFFGPQRLRAGWGLLLFAATLVLIDGAFFLTVRHRLSGELGLFLAEALLLVGVSGGTVVVAWVEGGSVFSYGLSDRRALSRLLWGGFWGLALLTLLIGWLFASGHIEIERRRSLGAESVEFGIAYAAGLFVVALAEEMLFRGYLQLTLARLIGFWPAAGVLSLAFGLMHRGNPSESALGLLAVMLFGGLFCLGLRLSGSLWWGIGFHAAWDWAQVFLWGRPVSGFVFEGSLMQSRAVGDPLWSGGATGPEGSLFVLPTLAFAVLVVVRSFGRASPVNTGPRVA